MPYIITNIEIAPFAHRPGASPALPLTCQRTIYDAGAQQEVSDVVTSIGAGHTVIITIRSTDGDILTGKEITVTHRMFAPDGDTSTPSTPDGFTATLVSPFVLYPMTWNGTTGAQNVEAAIIGSDTEAFISLSFQVATDSGAWPPSTYIPQNALLTAQNTAQIMTLTGAGAYAQDMASMQIAVRFRKQGTTNGFIFFRHETPSGTFATVVTIPTRARWYGRNSAGDAWAWRLDAVVVSVGGGVVSNTQYIAASNADNYDANYVTAGATGGEGCLSSFDNNEVLINIESVETKTFDRYELFLIKNDRPDLPAGSAIPHLDYYDYQSSDILPPGISTAGGAFAGTVDMLSTPGFVTITANIPGDALQYNQAYRVGVILYNSAECETYSVITPPMRAKLLPMCEPDATLELGNYCKHAPAASGLFSYHERITSCVTFDVEAYIQCMQDAGLDFSIDNIVYISMLHGLGVTGVVDGVGFTNVASWQNIAGTFSQIIADVDGTLEQNGNTFTAKAQFRISERLVTLPPDPAVGTFWPIAWVLDVNAPTPDGGFERVAFWAYQKIGINLWENDVNAPRLQIEAFDGDAWPERRAVRSLCSTEKIIFEVTKIGDLAGRDVSLMANYYTSLTGNGETVLLGILENDASEPGADSLLEQETNRPIYDLGEFTGDTATFCVNTSDLPLGVQTYVDAVTCCAPIVSCCPVMQPAPVVRYYTRRFGNSGYVYVIINTFRAMITGAGGANDALTEMEIINNITGTTQGISVLSSSQAIYYVRVNMGLGYTDVTMNLSMDAQFDCNGNTHDIRHSISQLIKLPIANQSWQLFNSSVDNTVCIDLTAQNQRIMKKEFDDINKDLTDILTQKGYKKLGKFTELYKKGKKEILIFHGIVQVNSEEPRPMTAAELEKIA